MDVRYLGCFTRNLSVRRKVVPAENKSGSTRPWYLYFIRNGRPKGCSGTGVSGAVLFENIGQQSIYQDVIRFFPCQYCLGIFPLIRFQFCVTSAFFYVWGSKKRCSVTGDDGYYKS